MFLDSEFVTRIPNNDIGKAAINSLRYFGVNTHSIIYGDGHMGLYYLEKSASQRPSKVIYNRKYPAISLVSVREFN